MVASYMELLADRYKGRLDERADKFIDYAVDGATRMKQLIDDLLDYSRIATRSRDSELIDAGSAFDEVTTNLFKAIAEKRAIVTQDDLPTMVVDRSHLVQLFQNLIGNALKFCDGTPRIHVEARRQGRKLGSSRCATTASASRQSTASGSFRSSSGCTVGRSTREPGSGWRSARRSSSSTAARSGSNRSRARAAPSSSRCPSRNEYQMTTHVRVR